jgi:CBS domain-containing protein
MEASTSLKEALKAMHDRGITGAPVYVDDVTGVSGALCSASPFVDVPPSFPPNPIGAPAHP